MSFNSANNVQGQNNNPIPPMKRWCPSNPHQRPSVSHDISSNISKPLIGYHRSIEAATPLPNDPIVQRVSNFSLDNLGRKRHLEDAGSTLENEIWRALGEPESKQTNHHDNVREALDNSLPARRFEENAAKPSGIPPRPTSVTPPLSRRSTQYELLLPDDSLPDESPTEQDSKTTKPTSTSPKNTLQYEKLPPETKPLRYEPLSRRPTQYELLLPDESPTEQDSATSTSPKNTLQSEQDPVASWFTNDTRERFKDLYEAPPDLEDLTPKSTPPNSNNPTQELSEASQQRANANAPAIHHNNPPHISTLSKEEAAELTALEKKIGNYNSYFRKRELYEYEKAQGKSPQRPTPFPEPTKEEGARLKELYKKLTPQRDNANAPAIHHNNPPHISTLSKEEAAELTALEKKSGDYNSYLREKNIYELEKIRGKSPQRPTPSPRFTKKEAARLDELENKKLSLTLAGDAQKSTNDLEQKTTQPLPAVQTIQQETERLSTSPQIGNEELLRSQELPLSPYGPLPQNQYGVQSRQTPNYPPPGSDSVRTNPFPEDKLPLFSEMDPESQTPDVRQYDNLPAAEAVSQGGNVSAGIQYSKLPESNTLDDTKQEMPRDERRFFSKEDANELRELRNKINQYADYVRSGGKKSSLAPSEQENQRYKTLLNKRDTSLLTALHNKAGPSPLYNLTDSEQIEFKALVTKRRKIGKYSLQKAKAKNDPIKFPLPKTPPVPLSALEQARYNELLKIMGF